MKYDAFIKWSFGSIFTVYIRIFYDGRLRQKLNTGALRNQKFFVNFTFVCVMRKNLGAGLVFC